ncbi:unnamed protein product [Pleuronectes platessa]|uniref:Uncharacterized protein n=1 Tax=Pleuronectes platessa TaxID=8262 RepID=A0A9N7U4I4_PLEPL|nr:unnamed protein product [Pleuronectes platessa]
MVYVIAASPVPPELSKKLSHFPEGSQAEKMRSTRQAERQTGRQADRQTGREADRQTGRQAVLGRAKVALEADTRRKDSFVTLVLKPYVTARSVCVGPDEDPESVMHTDVEGGFEAASLLSATCRPP